MRPWAVFYPNNCFYILRGDRKVGRSCRKISYMLMLRVGLSKVVVLPAVAD